MLNRHSNTNPYSTFFSSLAPILMFTGLPDQYPWSELTMEEDDKVKLIYALIGIACAGMQLISSKNEMKATKDMLSDTISYGAKQLHGFNLIKNSVNHVSSAILRLFSPTAISSSDTSQINKWKEKFKSKFAEFNIQDHDLDNYQSIKDFKIMYNRLKSLQNLLKNNVIQAGILNNIPPNVLLKIARDDRNIKLSSLEEQMSQLLELATRLHCFNIPMQIINRHHDRFHNENFLKLCVDSGNTKVFQEAAASLHYHLSSIVKLSVDSTMLSLVLGCTAWLGSKIINFYGNQFKIGKLNIREENFAELTTYYLLLSGGVLLPYGAMIGISYLSFLERAHHDLDEFRYLSITDEILVSAVLAKEKEIVTSCLFTNPALLQSSNLINPPLAKKFMTELLVEPKKLNAFLKNANKDIVSNLRDMFPDIQVFQNISSRKELLQLVTKSENEIRKNAKAVYLLAGRPHNLFASLPNEICLDIIAKTREPSVHCSDEIIKRKTY